MKIGISDGSYMRYGMEAAISRIAEHGYNAVDYQDFCHTETPLFQNGLTHFETTLRAHRALIQGEGLMISQVHGPWRWPMQDFTEEDRAERFEKMAMSVHGTAILGCKNFVIHNIMPFGDADTDPKAAVEMNREFFGRLLEVAVQEGVTICMENMPFTRQTLAKPADMLAFVKGFNSPNMRMCLDTGHAMVFGIQPAEAVYTIGKEYLACMHVHDNDGAHDYHWLPHTGVVDWKAFSKAIHDIGYEGVVSLETGAGGDTQAERDRNEIALAHDIKAIAEGTL